MGLDKRCSTCEAVKPLAEFSKDKYHASGHKSACRACASIRFNAWRYRDVEQIRKKERVSHYVRKYGLSKEEAKELVENRVGICEICSLEHPLVIDHCHVSGKVRGKLCSLCNSILGYSSDNPQILHSAISYLEKNGRLL